MFKIRNEFPILNLQNVEVNHFKMITHILTQRYQQEDKIFRDFFFGIQQATNNAPTAYFLICFEKITTKLEGIDIT